MHLQVYFLAEEMAGDELGCMAGEELVCMAGEDLVGIAEDRRYGEATY